MAHKIHIVKQGECISSIAFKNGLFPNTIWDDPKNGDLKEKRLDRNVLLPGDILYVRDKEQKQVPCACTKRHRFKRKGVPEKLKYRLLLGNEPRAGESYTLKIGDCSFQGTTDGDGRLEHWIPPDAKHGELIFQDGGEVYELRLGELDPIDTTSGVQGRLRHLGFYGGPIDGDLTPATLHAIQEFQLTQELEPDGELNDPTRSALLAAYGG